jgi:membrane protein
VSHPPGKVILSVIVERVKYYRNKIRHHFVLGEIYELIDGTLGDFVRDHGLIYAAAVSFYTLLSLVPLLVLVASAGGFALAFYGDGSQEALEQTLSQVMIHLRKIMPFLSPGFEDDLRQLVQNRGGLGMVGFLTMLLSSSQMFRALEFSFVRVFSRESYGATDQTRKLPTNIFLSKLIFAIFVTSLIVGYLLFRLMLNVLTPILDRLPFELGSVVHLFVGDSNFATDFLSAVGVIIGFAVILKFFSYNRVKTRFALLGGLVFYLSWQLTKVIYEYYLNQWTDLGALYGSFAVMMASVLWIFLSSVLVILCGYFVRTVERRWNYGSRWAGKPQFTVEPN